MSFVSFSLYVQLSRNAFVCIAFVLLVYGAKSHSPLCLCAARQVWFATVSEPVCWMRVVVFSSPRFTEQEATDWCHCYFGIYSMEFSSVSWLYFSSQGFWCMQILFQFRYCQVDHYILYQVLVLSVMCCRCIDEFIITGCIGFMYHVRVCWIGWSWFLYCIIWHYPSPTSYTHVTSHICDTYLLFGHVQHDSKYIQLFG